ncbi:MAG: M3 family oligoendopeptidase [Crocinitomicaceae bacterium]|nr:M3 family oligoendopeptidase [Crocinitomicaceae bacterium]
MNIEKSPRTFVTEGLEIKSWESIQPYFESLAHRPITSEADFQQWLKDRSELDAILEEDAAWRYIRMTIDTSNTAHSEAYKQFVTEIQPQFAPYEDLLNKKMIATPFADPEGKSQAYRIYHRSVQSALKLFREENIPLEAEMNEKSQEFGAISGGQTIEHEGQTMTMQKASLLLKEQDEQLRQLIFEKMSVRRMEDQKQLDALYNQLIQLRHQIAVNAGFQNYRDYKFEALGRFDYTKEDCFAFHQSIKSEIVPLVRQIQQKKLTKLGKTQFKPWDTELDPDGLAPLKPFSNGQEMLAGSIRILEKIDPYFGECITTMKEMEYLDLDSKPGKAPGGYNYPLYEIGVPFIFMNAVGAQRDLVTMVHEAGHAVHSFLSRDLELTGYKNLPSEVAELASMSMELLTMNEWSEFYNEADHKRAQKDQLETILTILPWIAQIDEFQHWVYEHPQHTVEERTEKWLNLGKEYGANLTDWTGFENVRASSWQRQMHLFEVPFYYIEYGFAQLGAIGVWKNSLENSEQAIEKYKSALELGYTKSIPEIYETAGVSFQFSQSYIKEIADFLQLELNKFE